MRKYSTQEQDTLVSSNVESNYQSVTTSVFCNIEDREADFYHMVLIKLVDNVVTTGEEDEDIDRELSKNEPSLTYDLIEAKCSTEFSFASASNAIMKLIDNLQETDDKANPTEDVDPNPLAKKIGQSKVIRGANKDNHKDGSNKSCAAESSDSFLSFSERESMTTIQDANNQEIEALRTEENSNESDTKNEECDKASKSDEGNVIRDNIGSPEKQKNEERLVPDPEAEKVNLKHQIEDERKSAEEWMLDYALQKAISQLALTQKRKVGLLVTAFENVVPPRGSNIQVTFPKLKSRNEVNLQTAGKGNTSVSNADNVREHVDKRNAQDDRSMSKNDDTQKAIVLCKKLDEVTNTSSDKGSVEIEGFGDSNDDSTSFTISNLGNDNDETQENNMNLSEWNEQLDKVNNNKTLAETNTDNSLHDFSEEKDDISHNGRSFSKNDVVNLTREAVLERARKVNPQPPRLLPPTTDQEQEKVDLRNQITDERKKVEQWMLDNGVQHMVNKLTLARKTTVAMLVEAFEAVVPLPEV
ncbi:hypothetical protein RDI58_025677 [Solanum bulbocastanum]|uniref:Calmodulin-binding domain-containing protein n=1 Tax=Solanum bulbocastanum TaxID=147425 RepID=A0AAN8Y4H5_SOLBU